MVIKELQSLASTIGSITERAVHIKIQPKPRNIHESREVLKVLKSFGDVISFRNLRYYASEPSPTTILAIYQEPDSARELMKASPFTFTLLARQRLKNITSPASLNILDVLGPVNPDLSEAEKDSDHPSGQKSEAREFQLIVDKSTMDHSSYIRRQQFYWGYSKKQMSSIAQDDLLKTVPLEGLACINANVPEMPHRLANKMTDELRRKKSLRRMWEERDTEVDR